MSDKKMIENCVDDANKKFWANNIHPNKPDEGVENLFLFFLFFFFFWDFGDMFHVSNFSIFHKEVHVLNCDFVMYLVNGFVCEFESFGVAIENGEIDGN